MQVLLILLSLFLFTIHVNNGFSIPKIEIQHPTKFVYRDKDGNSIEVSNPEKATLKEITYYHLVEKPYPQEKEVEDDAAEETKDSVEYPDIDQRTAPISDKKPSSNITLPEIRPKREIYLEKPDSGNRQHMHKRSSQSNRFERTYYGGWIPFVPGISRVEPVFITVNDDKSNSDDDRNIIEYLQEDESNENNNNSAEDDVNVEKNKDSEKDSQSVHTNTHKEDTFSLPEESDNHEISEEQNDYDDQNSYPENETDEPCEDDNCNEAHENTPSMFIELIELLHKIFVEHNATIQWNNSENYNVLSLIHDIIALNYKPTNLETNIDTNPDKPTYLNVLKGIFANKIKNNIIINNEVPKAAKPIDVSATKDEINDTEAPKIQENINSNVDLKDHEKTTEILIENTTPTSGSGHTDIEHSTEKYVTTPSLDASTKEVVAIENFNDQLPQDISEVLPIKTDSSSKTDEPNKAISPFEEDSHLEKQIDSEVHKKIDQLVDLVNNENLWKFLGEFGNKYLESLLTHTNALIKEQIAAQVKENLDSNKKHDEKIVLEKEKDNVKDIVTTEKNKEPVTEKIETTTIDSRKHNAHQNKNNDTNKHNVFGHSVDNDKVTNIYVFYGGDDIDEVIKYIHQYVNKTGHSPHEHSNGNKVDEIKQSSDKYHKIKSTTLKAPTTAVESEQNEDAKEKEYISTTDEAISKEPGTEIHSTSESIAGKETLYTNDVKNDDLPIETELTTNSVIETTEESPLNIDFRDNSNPVESENER